jgi:hypothetical protein
MPEQEILHVSVGPAEVADASRALRKQRKRLRAILRLKTKVSLERALVTEEKAKVRGEANTRKEIARLQRIINPNPGPAPEPAALVAGKSKDKRKEKKKAPKPAGVTVVSSSFDTANLAYILSGTGPKPAAPPAAEPEPEPEPAPLTATLAPDIARDDDDDSVAASTAREERVAKLGEEGEKQAAMEACGAVEQTWSQQPDRPKHVEQKLAVAAAVEGPTELPARDEPPPPPPQKEQEQEEQEQEEQEQEQEQEEKEEQEEEEEEEEEEQQQQQQQQQEEEEEHVTQRAAAGISFRSAFGKRSARFSVAVLEGHADGITACALLGRDGERLVSSSFDGTVKWWDTVTERQLQSHGKHKGSVAALALQHEREGARLVSVSRDGCDSRLAQGLPIDNYCLGGRIFKTPRSVRGSGFRLLTRHDADCPRAGT